MASVWGVLSLFLGSLASSGNQLPIMRQRHGEAPVCELGRFPKRQPWPAPRMQSVSGPETPSEGPPPVLDPQTLRDNSYLFPVARFGGYLRCSHREQTPSLLVEHLLVAGSVPSTLHYSFVLSSQWPYEEVSLLSPFSVAETEAQEALINVPQVAELENGEAGIWIEAFGSRVTLP